MFRAGSWASGTMFVCLMIHVFGFPIPHLLGFLVANRGPA